MQVFTPKELLPIFKEIQNSLESSSQNIEATSLEEACINTLHSFLGTLNVVTSVTDNINKIISLLQSEHLSEQEMGLTLLEGIEEEEYWTRITKGFHHAPDNWDECFNHQMYRVTLGLLRAWAKNPYADHSQVKALKLRADFLEEYDNITFVKHFKHLEHIDLRYMYNLSSLSGLEESSKLKEIRVENTRIVDLSGLGNNPDLTTIKIKGTPVKSLTGLNITNQDLSIDARQTPLTDVSAIPTGSDTYLCVDNIPTVGSTAVTYLRCSDEWIIDIGHFPNIHTIYLENPLHSLKGLMELKNLQHVFVRSGSTLVQGSLQKDIKRLKTSTWSRHSIMFGDYFYSIPVENWNSICAQIQKIESKSTRTFHICDSRLWNHCSDKIVSVCLLSSGTIKGVVDCTDLATLPNLKRLEMELSLETTVLKIKLPPLEHLSKLTWTGCSSKRVWPNTRQYLECVEINSPVLVESLVIQDFPALKNTFLRNFPLDTFPNLKKVVIRRCPKLSKRMATKLFKDIDFTME